MCALSGGVLSAKRPELDHGASVVHLRPPKTAVHGPKSHVVQPAGLELAARRSTVLRSTIWGVRRSRGRVRSLALFQNSCPWSKKSRRPFRLVVSMAPSVADCFADWY
jgi:hypothetical protein